MAVPVAADARTLLSGNEAVARGSYEAGVRVAAGYPGTPSTEILETLASYAEIDTRWSPNEKVALDVALGASLGGVRALAAMKHVGLNVASDTLMTAAYTGVGAGLVVVSADDPGMHSSQNEQDNRLYGRFAGVPVLEPSDSGEAKALTRLAFEISEEFDTPVLLRTTTRVSHGRSLVELEPPLPPARGRFRRNASKYVMVPAHARARRPLMLERLARLRAYAEASSLTVVEERDRAVGVVTAGVAYQYVRDVLPAASVLKLGLSYPLPLGRIRAFAAGVKRLFVVEELEPFLEESLREAGIAVEGKAFFPRAGELTPDVVRDGFTRAGVLAGADDSEARQEGPATIPRPPVLCPGCPHVVPFLALRHLGATVAGDIGCYTLAALPPLEAMDTQLAMGCSIGMAVGLAVSAGAPGPVVAALGDSTLLHAGVPALVEAATSRSNITVLVLDNGTTAMTGGQLHPGTGLTLRGEEAPPVDLVALCRAIGIEHVEVVDPYDVGRVYATLEAAIAHPGPAVVITNRPCVEAPVKIRDRPFEVSSEACIACQLCMNLGCPSIAWTDERYDGRPKVEIDAGSCTGCTVCAQLCPTDALRPVDTWERERG